MLLGKRLGTPYYKAYIGREGSKLKYLFHRAMLELQGLQTIDYIKNIISFGRMQIWRMQSHNLPYEAIIDFQSSHGGNSAVV